MRIKELDGLRGIAVLAVLDHHYLPWLPQTGSGYGWLGVDLFFILSGFLITSILLELRDKEHYFKIFYARRAIRIFPPYFLGIGVYLIYSFASGYPGTWALWMQYIFYYTSLFVGQPPALHAIPQVVPPMVALGLASLWTLSVEEIYYTVWAPVVRYTTQRSFTAILIAMILIAPTMRWILHTPKFPEIFTFYCRMDGLAYGSVIALLIRERRLNPAKWVPWDKWFDRLTLTVVPLAAAFWLITRGDQTNRIVTCFGLILADVSFALIAHALIRNAGGGQFWARAFRAKWLRSVGMVSYSLYLFNYPIRLFSAALVSRMHLPRRPDAVLAVIVGLIMSFVVAFGLWYGMESRILHWKDRRIPSPAHP